VIDNQHISACIKGDHKAHNEFYDHFAPYVYAIVKSHIHDDSYRKDVMQEVFAQIFLSLKSFDPNKGVLKYWVATITSKRCITWIKKHQKFKLNQSLEDTILSVSNESENTDHLSRAELQELISKMPVGYRTVFILHIIEGYNHKEIAALLDISTGGSRSQLSRAISWIKKSPSTLKQLRHEIS